MYWPFQQSWIPSICQSLLLLLSLWRLQMLFTWGCGLHLHLRWNIETNYNWLVHFLSAGRLRRCWRFKWWKFFGIILNYYSSLQSFCKILQMENLATGEFSNWRIQQLANLKSAKLSKWRIRVNVKYRKSSRVAGAYRLNRVQFLLTVDNFN